MEGKSLPPNGSELGTSYQTLANNVVENTLSMDSAKVFADVLAVSTMKANANLYPENAALSASVSETRLADGTTKYNVALQDRVGGGVKFDVGSDLSIRVTPIQGSPNGPPRELPPEQFLGRD